MNSPSESSEAKPEGGRPAPDPLASPTLAALYASQGHADLAEAIYARLGRRPEKSDPLDPGRNHPQRPEADQTFLQRLLFLREAARQIREAGGPGREGSG